VTAPVVRWMFAQRLAGHSVAQITWALNHAAIPCPSASVQKGGTETRTARGLILAGCAVVVVAALVILYRAPVQVWAGVAAVAVPLLARAGRPAHKPIVTAATLPATVQAPSQDVITRALGSLGIAGIDRWLRDGHQLVSPRSVRTAPAGGPRSTSRMGDRGHGDRAPRAARLRAAPAAGQRVARTGHLRACRAARAVGGPPGRRQVQAGPWPLARGGQADVFQPIPYGTDVPGRRGPADLPELAARQHPAPGQDGRGADPGLRRRAGPAGRDGVHELKGSGDLDPLERVARRFVSGVDDESIGYAAKSLRLLRAEGMRLTERLKALDRALCPDKRVTRQIAANGACGCGRSSV
jgi:DNA segregation ATPase FtsK/SpoIIIE, S-DNA-T family